MVQDHMPDTVLEVLGKVILYMNIFLNYLILKIKGAIPQVLPAHYIHFFVVIATNERIFKSFG